MPPLPAGQAVLRMRYGHFGCNVVHEDIAFAPAVDDPHAAKMQLKCEVEALGGRLPAGHGHGTEYGRRRPRAAAQPLGGDGPAERLQPRRGRPVGGAPVRQRWW